MGPNSKIIVIAVSIAILQCIEAATVSSMKPNPVRGCPPINPSIRCIFFNQQCNAEIKPCSGIQICCPNECGTSCRVPDYYTSKDPIKNRSQPSTYQTQPTLGDLLKKILEFLGIKLFKIGLTPPASNTTIGLTPPASNTTIGLTPPASNTTIGLTPPASNITYVCPPIDPQIQCIWFNEECNADVKQCPASSICCSNNCGSSCRGPNGEYVPNNSLE